MASKNAAAASKALEKEFDFRPEIFANGNKGETIKITSWSLHSIGYIHISLDIRQRLFLKYNFLAIF
jgi:hypothetical protein